MTSLIEQRSEKLLPHSYAQVRARLAGEFITEEMWLYYLKRWKQANGAEPKNLGSVRDKLLNLNAFGEMVMSRYE